MVFNSTISDLCDSLISRGLWIIIITNVVSGPVHKYPDILESATFFYGYGYRPHVSSEFDSESEKKLICSPEWKKYICNESNNVWSGESRYFLIR